jgi:ABC-type branched-subunit amino acid transport system substrate-binding protein
MYGSPPQLEAFSASAYDGLQMIVLAMRAGNMEAETIASYFNTNLGSYKGVLGELQFDEKGDILLDLRLRMIEDGERVFLK